MMKIDVEWDSQARSRGKRSHYHRKASTIHGWVTKLRGTLSGNERVRAQGIKEMREAAARRKQKRKRESGRRAHKGGFLSWLLGSSSSHKRSKSRSSHGSRRKGDEPWMHFSKRSKPSYHGHGTRIGGLVIRDKGTIAQGKAMQRRAAEERERERRRRHKQQKRDARAMKADARSSGRRR